MSIQLKNITMQFKDTVAVNRLNLTIPEGELVSLLGPSGCGKSTTLFMIAGLLTPTEGEIYFSGENVTKKSPEKRNIGMVFQNYALYPHMSVLKNIMFPLKMQKVPSKEAKMRAIEASKLVEIDHLLDRKPSELSGGQQQRVAIARAIVREPDVLLLDEPLSNLDAKLRLSMREEIREIQQRLNITTLFVTHDQEEALSISDHVVLMNQGKIEQFATPTEIYSEPTSLFAAEFIGSPPMNIFKDVSEAQLKALCPNVPFSNEIASIGIRPEDLLIKDDGLKVTVKLVETVGKDTLITVEHDHFKRFKLFVHKDEYIEQNGEYYVQVNPENMLIFDKEGQCIHHGGIHHEIG